MDFYDLFVNVPESIVVLSPDYKVLAATDTYLKTTNRKREEILGLQFLLEAYPDKELPYEENPVKISLDKVLKTKEVDFLDVIRYDIARPASEGGGYEERYWEASHTPVLDEAGEIRYIIQNTHDVTERERAKHLQSESEAKFKALTDAVPQLIYTAAPDGSLTYLNERWTEYTGLTLEESYQDGWAEFVHPDDLKTLKDRLKDVFIKGDEFQAELRIRNKEGQYRWFYTKSLPIRDSEGNVLMRVGSSTDIQDTKQLVQELLESNEQLSVLADQVQQAFQKAEDQRQTLENLIMQMPAIFAILRGPEHRFELVNPYYQKLFPKRNLLGKKVIEAVPEVEEQGFIQILDNVYNTATPFVANEIKVEADWQDIGKTEEAFFTTTYQPLLEGDKVTGILVFGYEVTESVKLRHELQQLRDVQQ